MRKKFLLVAAMFGVAIMATSFNFGDNKAVATVPGNNVLVSINNTGDGQGGNQDSYDQRLSADGRYVGFISAASNLVAGDTNLVDDIFVRDVGSNITKRANISTASVQADANSEFNAISSSGRYVLFSSYASNLIDGQPITSYDEHVYLRDMVANTTVLISKNTSNAVANNTSFGQAVSSDGRFVLFRSKATNLVSSVTSGSRNHMYIADLKLNTVTLISASTSGTPANDYTNNASMSCDGSMIVFESAATNIVGSDSNGQQDIFLVDRRGGSTTVDAITLASNEDVYGPQISCNGDYIGFTTTATNIDTSVSVTGTIQHQYRYDRRTAEFLLTDKSSSGTVANAHASAHGQGGTYVIADSGVVLFSTAATNLTSVSTASGRIHLIFRNPEANTTETVSMNSSGVSANANVLWGGLSADGRKTSFASTATNLTASDTNGRYDIFHASTGY